MTKSSHLWAVGFDDIARADQAQGTIAKLAEGHSLALLDWAIAVRYADGAITLNGEPTRDPIGTRGLAHFLAGLMLAAPPLTGAAIDAYDGGCEVGIREDFVRQVEALMKPGSSALFVLDDGAAMDAVLNGIRGVGGTVLKTNVDLERAALVQRALSAASEERRNSATDQTRTTHREP
jgi:uncharacterized membrane protein